MWIIGDHYAEMTTALLAIEVEAANICFWDVRRSSYSPELLKEERPHWLLIHQPRAAGDAGGHGARTRRRIASLIGTQLEHGGLFAFYCSPAAAIWDVEKSPELKRYIEEWYLTELRRTRF